MVGREEGVSSLSISAAPRSAAVLTTRVAWVVLGGSLPTDDLRFELGLSPDMGESSELNQAGILGVFTSCLFQYHSLDLTAFLVGE